MFRFLLVAVSVREGEADVKANRFAPIALERLC
jgi:hypothetical protein